MNLTPAQRTLVGALVGLARSLDSGNTRRETPELILSALRCLGENRDCTQEIQAVREEKHRAVPDCSTCMNPCGRTFDLTQEEVAALDDPRQRLLEALITRSRQEAPGQADPACLPHLTQALFALGYEWFPPEELEEIENNLLK